MPDTLPPVVAIVGRKNSGKTTLLVAVAAELRERGVRVASMKHGHHAFEFDREGRDSWRHFHEGGAEAVIMAAGDRIGMVMRTDEAERDPAAVLRRFYGGRGYHLILVEGFKHGPFPRVEVHRAAVHDRPLLAAPPPTGAPVLALVTDAPPTGGAGVRVIPMRADGAHVRELADLLVSRIAPEPREPS